jgi:ribosomal protein S18 acetylase RimI-like enzyme
MPIYNIRSFEPSDLSAIKAIVAALHPRWFDDHALENMPKDVQLGKTFMAVSSEQIVGFINLTAFEGKAYINWLGVDPKFHRQKIGTQLLIKAQEHCLSLGYTTLRAKTVVHQDPPDNTYDLTLKFYVTHSFIIEKTFKTQTFEHFTYNKGILTKDLKTL